MVPSTSLYCLTNCDAIASADFWACKLFAVILLTNSFKTVISLLEYFSKTVCEFAIGRPWVSIVVETTVFCLTEEESNQVPELAFSYNSFFIFSISAKIPKS